MSKDTKKINYYGSTLAIVFGLFSFIGSVNMFSDPIAGLSMAMGGFTYMGTKKQLEKKSQFWKITQITSAALLIVIIILGLSNGGWNVYPIGYILVPTWTLIAYILLKRHSK